MKRDRKISSLIVVGLLAGLVPSQSGAVGTFILLDTGRVVPAPGPSAAVMHVREECTGARHFTLGSGEVPCLRDLELAGCPSSPTDSCDIDEENYVPDDGLLLTSCEWDGDYLIVSVSMIYSGEEGAEGSMYFGTSSGTVGDANTEVAETESPETVPNTVTFLANTSPSLGLSIGSTLPTSTAPSATIYYDGETENYVLAPFTLGPNTWVRLLRDPAPPSPYDEVVNAVQCE